MERVFHTWDKWECYPAGFYENKPIDILASKLKGKFVNMDMKREQCEAEYTYFLRDIGLFENAMERVLKEWKISSEHYLTNDKMNRIAWLGQASLCIEKGIPACYCGGFNDLTEIEQHIANLTALKYLNKWLLANGGIQLTIEEAASRTKANIY